MAFPIGKKEVAPALQAAIDRVAADKETPSSFGYGNGSPQKNPPFAYEREGPRALVKKYIDEVGGLGLAADDKGFKAGQQYFKAFMEQEMNSVVGRDAPLSGGMA